MDLRSMELAHDMRTPIQLIYSCVQLLEMELAPNARAESYLQTLMQSAGQLQSMVEHALDGEKLHLELRDVVAEARDLCRQSTLFARRRGIGVRFSSNVPELRMLIDVEKLRRMLNNLLSNALRFTEDGGSVEVSCVASTGELELRVRDHGCGIPPEMQARIFENGVTDGGYGYGLGIVQGYARLLGGDISVESAPGAGSCFILRLPARHAPQQIN